MATQLQGLVKGIDRLKKRIPDIIANGLKRTAHRVVDDVVDAMPVQTGRLANNWEASPTKASRGFDQSKRGTKQSAKTKLHEEIDRINVTKRDAIYLNNPTPYGRYTIDHSKTNEALARGARKAGKDLEEEFYKEFKKELG